MAFAEEGMEEWRTYGTRSQYEGGSAEGAGLPEDARGMEGSLGRSNQLGISGSTRRGKCRSGGYRDSWIDSSSKQVAIDWKLRDEFLFREQQKVLRAIVNVGVGEQRAPQG